MRLPLAALLLLLLLVACRPPPEATPHGAHHLMIVASHPVADAKRAGLSPEQLDQIDDLLLPRGDWTGPLETGDEVHVLVSNGQVRAVRIDGRRLQVAGAFVAGEAVDERGQPVSAHHRLRPVATRSLTSYPLVSFEQHDPVRVERGNNGLIYGVKVGTIVTATSSGEAHVLACSGMTPTRWCEIEVRTGDDIELWVTGPVSPLVKTGDVVRVGQPLGHVPAHSLKQLRYGLVGQPSEKAPDRVDRDDARQTAELITALGG
jgi:hypothetical protein